jgi:MFS transporter, DHA1 family, inner membrane transport protein
MTDIEQSYVPRGVYGRLAVLAAGLFVVGTNAFVIAGVLPLIAASLGVTPAAVSYSITFYAIVVAIASPVVSIVFGRLSRTRLMAGGLALIAIGTGIAALAGSIEVFTAGRVVAALGGAALVPAATAAAPSLMPASQRGRALAIAGVGFTLASAAGSPLGTALAAIGGWRLSIGVLAVLAAVLAVVVALVVRDVPIGAIAGVRHRLAPLADHRMVLALVATLLLLSGFNMVYIFSSAVTHGATAGSGSVLAILLLLCGIGGVIGTAIGGRVVDRFGGRATFVAALALEVVVYVVLAVAGGSLVATAAAFVVWGIAGFAAVVAVQDRLVGINPATAGIALSWYSTAMYLGIALAPVAGAAALGVSASVVPLVGAVTALLALIAFAVSYANRRGSSAAVA